MPNIGPLEILILLIMVGVPIGAVIAIVVGIRRSNRQEPPAPPTWPSGPEGPPPR